MKDDLIGRRGFLRSLALGLGVLLVPRLSPVRSQDQEKQPPNIVYILADDMGYGDLACQNPEEKAGWTLSQLRQHILATGA